MSAPAIQSQAMAAPLEARGLCHRYGSKVVLDDIDLALVPGTVLGLIGRNGAGKSTLIQAMLGLLVPDAGHAFVYGEEALRMSDACRQRLSYMPQQADALPWLSAAQMFDYLSRFYARWDHQFVRDTLARWQIDTDKAMAKLSPGERQRVDLIRVLASKPELLVLDEPASALDPVVRRELLREIALRAGESGTTVLFSTHIVSDLERIASDVAFLHNGRLLLHCPMDDTKERYARLWLPTKLAGAAPESPFGIHRGEDGSASVIVERGADGWPEATQLPGARMDAIGLEDLFVEIAE